MWIELMRQIDRWLGGFLVMILAPFAVFRRPSPVPHYPGFGPNPPERADGGWRRLGFPLGGWFRRVGRNNKDLGAGPTWSPRTIVVSKYFGMGSIILSVPLLRGIRAQCPSARIVFLSFSSNQKLLTFIPCVDEIIAIRTSPHSFVLDTLRTLWRLRRRRVDLFLDLEFYSRYSALMNFCSGAGTRVGFHTLSLSSRGRLLTHRVYLNPYRHAMENFLALGGAVGIAARDRTLALRSFRAAEERKGFVWLRKHGLTPGRYVLFSPLGDLVKALKSYPEERWAELADALYRQAGCPSVVVAATADRRWDLKVSRVRNYLHNLTGKTSFTALMVLIKHALCLISVDTGIAHLAAVFQVPTLTLFGPETPQLYAPVNPRGQVVYANLHCSPCVNLLEGKGSDCRNNVCINQWTAQEVCQRVVALLRNPREGGPAVSPVAHQLT